MVEIGHQSGTQALFKTFVVLLQASDNIAITCCESNGIRAAISSNNISAPARG